MTNNIKILTGSTFGEKVTIESIYLYYSGSRYGRVNYRVKGSDRAVEVELKEEDVKYLNNEIEKRLNNYEHSEQDIVDRALSDLKSKMQYVQGEIRKIENYEK